MPLFKLGDFAQEIAEKEVLAHAVEIPENGLAQWCADDTLWPARSEYSNFIQVVRREPAFHGV